MSRRDYPYYAGREKYRGKPKNCDCCPESATHQVTIQVSIFRGDNEVYLACERHALMAKTDYNAFVDAGLERQAYLSQRIHAQHEETGRAWTGARRNLPPRYVEFTVSESAP